MNSPTISIVVPVFDEQHTLATLIDEIREVADAEDLRFAIVFVDDGSRDGSWQAITELCRQHPPGGDSRLSVGGLRFRTNSGKAAALMAGFSTVRTDLVFMMDADLQDPPAEIPHFLQKLDEGYDMVSGWKKIRHDPWHKVYPSRVFNRMIGVMTGVRLHDHVCGFKLLKSDIARQLRLYGGLHRFVSVLSHALGARVTEIPTLHRPRTSGVSKYGFTRFFKGFMDMMAVWFLTRYKYRPQHVLGVAGVVWFMLILAFGLLGMISSLGGPFLYLAPIYRLHALLLVLSPGVILLALGLMAAAGADRQNLDHQYDIVERAGWCVETKPAP